jgi:hypothetical protein
MLHSTSQILIEFLIYNKKIKYIILTYTKEEVNICEAKKDSFITHFYFYKRKHMFQLKVSIRVCKIINKKRKPSQIRSSPYQLRQIYRRHVILLWINTSLWICDSHLKIQGPPSHGILLVHVKSNRGLVFYYSLLWF